jgi:hypothetical protein
MRVLQPRCQRASTLILAQRRSIRSRVRVPLVSTDVSISRETRRQVHVRASARRGMQRAERRRKYDAVTYSITIKNNKD